VQVGALPPAASPAPSSSSHDDALQRAILEIVRKLDRVSFAELPIRLADVGLLVGTGNHALTFPQFNVVLWDGLDEKLCAAVVALLQSKRLYLAPLSWLDYAADGCCAYCVTLPIARRAGHCYKRPRWLPACLRLVPLE
jgi:hypothetical protein